MRKIIKFWFSHVFCRHNSPYQDLFCFWHFHITTHFILSKALMKWKAIQRVKYYRMSFFRLDCYMVCAEIHHNICNYDVWMIYDFSCLTKKSQNTHLWVFHSKCVSWIFDSKRIHTLDDNRMPRIVCEYIRWMCICLKSYLLSSINHHISRMLISVNFLSFCAETLNCQISIEKI